MEARETDMKETMVGREKKDGLTPRSRTDAPAYFGKQEHIFFSDCSLAITGSL